MEEQPCFKCGTRYKPEEDDIEHLCSDCKLKREQKPLDNTARIRMRTAELKGSVLVKLAKTGVFILGICFFAPFIIMVLGGIFPA